MKVKIITNAVCVFLFACMMVGCNNFPDPDSYDRNIAITDIYLEVSSVRLIVGGSQTITFWPLPANADPMKLEWTSSDPSVATCDRWGRVATLKEGTATLTVSAGTVSKTVSVTVLPDPADFARFVVGEYSGTAALAGMLNIPELPGVSVSLERVGSSQSIVKMTLVASVPGFGVLTISGDQTLAEASGVYTMNGTASLPGMTDFTVTGTVNATNGALTADLVSPGVLTIAVSATKQ